MNIGDLVSYRNGNNQILEWAIVASDPYVPQDGFNGGHAVVDVLWSDGMFDQMAVQYLEWEA